MKTLTTLETIVLQAIKSTCYTEYSAHLRDIVKITNIDSKRVRGVLSSLIKKEKIINDGKDYWFIKEDGQPMSHGIDDE